MSQKKPPERRQRRGTDDLQVVPIGEVRKAPAPPKRVRKDIVRRWEAFWRSDIASQVEPSDHDALRRLFRLYDEIERLWDGIDGMGRVVEGSQGQPRPNPLFKQIEAFQAECRQLEDRFGLSPRARFNLGISFAAASASFDDLNARLASKVEGSGDPFSADEEAS